MFARVVAAIGRRIGQFVVISLSTIPVIAHAQVPPTTVKPKLPPSVPTLSLPVVSRVMMIDGPNFNTSTPFTLLPAQQAKLTVQLDKTFTAATTVQLRYTAGVLQGPASVTIPAGVLYTDFVATAILVKTPQTGSVRAFTLDSAQAKSAIISVVPSLTCSNPAPIISPAQSQVLMTTTLLITVSLSCAPSAPVQIALSSSLPGVITPPGGLLTVGAMQQTTQYTASIGAVSTTTIVTLSASISGSNPLVRAPDVSVVVRRP